MDGLKNLRLMSKLIEIKIQSLFPIAAAAAASSAVAGTLDSPLKAYKHTDR